jgi:hypothetical protein
MRIFLSFPNAVVPGLYTYHVGSKIYLTFWYQIIIIIIGSTALRGPLPSSEVFPSLDFVIKSIFQGGVVSPTSNPQLSWRADVFCQGCLS